MSSPRTLIWICQNMHSTIRIFTTPPTVRTQVVKGDPKRILVCFGGLMHSFGKMNSFEWLRSTRRMKCTRVYVQDLSQSWYTANSAWWHLYLKELIFGAKHVCFMGTSAGGYAAMHFGHMLTINRVIAFGPQVALTEDERERIGDRKWRRHRTNLAKKGISFAPSHDLTRSLSGIPNHFTQYHVHFCKKCPTDKRSAWAVADCDGVALHPHNCNDHNSAKWLRKHNKLLPIIKEGMAA